MNEKLRKLLENHGIDVSVGSIEYWQNEIEMALIEMYDEIEAKERQGCADDYLKIMRDAVEAARQDEREACAVLVEGGNHVHPKAPDAVWAKTVARLIRARGEPNSAFKNYLDDKWSGIV